MIIIPVEKHDDILSTLDWSTVMKWTSNQKWDAARPLECPASSVAESNPRKLINESYRRISCESVGHICCLREKKGSGIKHPSCDEYKTNLVRHRLHDSILSE